MTSVLALAIYFGSSSVQAKPTELARKFKVGEKLGYFARAQFTEEERSGQLQTFIPNDEEISYHYSMTVQKVKSDGFAEVLYQRPTMDITEGDTAEASAKKTTEKLDIKLQMDISPINEIVQVKDLNPPKKSKDKDGFMKTPLFKKVMRQGTTADRVALGLLGAYLGDIQRLAFFVGPVESGLDIAPKFPLDEVNIGGTWKGTVGYSPQKLKGQGDKQAVQRIDYTYTYMGPMKNKEGKDIQRVQAKIKLDTDMIDYARQLVGGSASSTMFKSVPLKFEGTVDFDLDPTTFDMIRATAESKGSFAISTKNAEQPLIENRFHGRTSVKLEGRSSVPISSATTPAGTSKGKGGG